MFNSKRRMNSHGFDITLKQPCEFSIILTFQRWEPWEPRKRFCCFLKFAWLRQRDSTPPHTQSYCLLLKSSSYTVSRNVTCTLSFFSVDRLVHFLCSNLDSSQSFSFQPHGLENVAFCLILQGKVQILVDPDIVPFCDSKLSMWSEKLEVSLILVLWGVHEKKNCYYLWLSQHWVLGGNLIWFGLPHVGCQIVIQSI